MHPSAKAAPDASGRSWRLIVVAALAMVATLPGRTHGLGLITEPFIADLHLDRVSYASINLWATLIGAAFCVPCGWLIDCWGGRTVLLAVTIGLAASVVAMASANASWGATLIPSLFALLLLTRGFGQSALSVVSLAIMGRSVGRRGGLGVGVYSFVTAVGFMLAFIAVKHGLETQNLGWRPLWSGIGIFVALFGVVAFFVIGRQGTNVAVEVTHGTDGLTLAQSVRTLAFWVFAGATSLYGLIAAGLSLFNQSILAERGFDRGVFLTITAVSPIVGLAANLAAGWLAIRTTQGRLLAFSMVLLAAALLAFPFVRSLAHVYLYAVTLGVAGGIVTVVFFGVWGELFGLAHVGKIQGAAQMMTVLASASGPLLLAEGQQASGSYVPVFRYASLVAGFFAIAAWFVTHPRQT